MLKKLFALSLSLCFILTLTGCKREYQEGDVWHLRGTYKNKSIGLQVKLPEGESIFAAAGNPIYKFSTSKGVPLYLYGEGIYNDLRIIAPFSDINIFVIDLAIASSIGGYPLEPDISEDEMLDLYMQALQNNYTDNILAESDVPITTDNLYNFIITNKTNTKLASANFVTQGIVVEPLEKNGEFWQDLYTVMIRRADDLIIVIQGHTRGEYISGTYYDGVEYLDEMFNFFKKA